MPVALTRSAETIINITKFYFLQFCWEQAQVKNFNYRNAILERTS